MKTLKQLRGDQRGMTLVEVVTALILFAVVFLILFYGINSALKVMNNANAINNATQSNASGLESLGTTLEQSQKATLTDLGDKLTISGKAINGTFKKAMTAKSNDNTNMSLYLFDPVKLTGTVPTPAMPSVKPITAGQLVPYVPNKNDTELNTEENATNGQNGKLKPSSDTKRIVITGTTLNGITGSDDKGSIEQLFFAKGSEVAFNQATMKATYHAKFFYIDGSITGMTKNKQYNTFTLSPYSGTTGILLYLGTDATITFDSNKITVGTTIGNNQIRAGYYYLPDAIDLLTIAKDAAVLSKFNTDYISDTSGGYYLNFTNSSGAVDTASAGFIKLAAELKARDIKLVNGTTYIDPGNVVGN